MDLFRGIATSSGLRKVADGTETDSPQPTETDAPKPRRLSRQT